jgi:hypothetical protein
MAKFSDLVGVTLSEAFQVGYDEIHFKTEGGRHWRLHHSQDCCENVEVEDICGELQDLVGSPIMMAEESESSENPEGYSGGEYQRESFTWTFYRLATVNGYVNMRFYGYSNGYYSEGVDFEEFVKGDWSR